ncbi:MAG: alpha/beta superfamily hydrolase [Pseudohongiellaceae bacterium]|jgi:alpha/beta superfamily hydrolase
MDSKVVYTLAKSLAKAGLHVVRFNFRGVSGSEGRHDRGEGELNDARAALDFAAELVGEAAGSVLMAGFSFGSWVGLNVGADDDRVAALLAVAPPVNFYDFSAAVESDKPLSVIYALDDELVSVEAVQSWLGTVNRPHLVTPVAAAGHLFHGRLGALRTGVAATLRFVTS